MFEGFALVLALAALPAGFATFAPISVYVG